MNEWIKEKLAVLPEQPGCYLMKDKNGEIIYVGKAKVLKNRVRSYFNGAHEGKTQRLVQEIADFEYIITASNLEALILELNLIKKHDPKYNIMLKDDKTYPYIKITNEKYPRVMTTRNVKKDGGKYFGPYPSASAANETKKLLDRVYPLRKCNKLPTKACVYYHLNQCLAPCIQEVSDEQSKEIVHEMTRVLSGKYDFLKVDLEKKMLEAAEKLEFERAKEYRDQIQAIETVLESQNMMDKNHLNRDYFAYAVDKGWMCVQVFFIRQGKLIEREVSIFPIYDDATEALTTFMATFYLEKLYPLPKEIYVPEGVDIEMLCALLKVAVYVPKKGKKKELLQLATVNAKTALQEKFLLLERNEERTYQASRKLGEAIGRSNLSRIEAFDNSNIQGSSPVSAMIVFIDGKPQPKLYRKFKIQTVEGPDDYQTMAEVIRRRYTRVLRDGLPLPDLILVDGGKGQIKVAKEILEDELNLHIPVAGLAKDERHRTSQLLYGDPLQISPLDRNSHAFYLLHRIQDEVHRFAITFHRQVHSKSLFQSFLDDIPGVGEKRKRQLLKHFGSVKKMKEATLDELIAAKIPQNIAKLIYEKKASYGKKEDCPKSDNV